MYKINKLQGHIVQHKEYSQFFKIMNGVQSLKIMNHYVAHLKLMFYYKLCLNKN